MGSSVDVNANHFNLPALSRPQEKDQLRRLQAKHQLMIRLHLEGATATEIATQLSVTPKTVLSCLHSDIGLEKIQQLQEIAEIDALDVAKMISRGAVKGAKLLAEMAAGEGQGENATLNQRFKAGLELLKMEGFTPVTRTVHTHGYAGQNPLEDLKRHNAEIIEAFPVPASASSDSGVAAEVATKEGSPDGDSPPASIIYEVD